MKYSEGAVNFQHVFLWLFVFFCFWLYSYTRKRKYRLFPGPRGLPILGNLPFLGPNPHEELTKLSKKYGNIFSVYLGRSYMLVVTDIDVIKQLFAKASTADRPPGMFQLLPDGGGFAELNGAEWIEQRRYTVKEMKNLGFGRSHWEELVQMEVSDVMKQLAQSKGEPLDASNILAASISNNVLSLVSDSRLPMGHPKRRIMDRGVESFQLLYNPSGIIAHFPSLFRLFVNLGLLRVKDKVQDLINFNKCVRKEIEDSRDKTEINTFISTYLSEIERNERLKLGNSFNDDNLRGNVQALIIAGSDTTFVSLQWLLLAMATYPDIQKIIHQELDAVLGKDGTIDYVDRQKLPYVLATIMEGQRWRTVVPLNLLHRTNEDMTFDGYDIPRGTNILSIIWAVHNDTRYWKDPESFRPERFLTEDGYVIAEPEAYMPFSSGKRICPGKTVALIELFQYFVTIMQNFQILPISETCKPDLKGYPGLTFQPKKQPLRFVARK